VGILNDASPGKTVSTKQNTSKVKKKKEKKKKRKKESVCVCLKI
jgi:hypothetical protein